MDSWNTVVHEMILVGMRNMKAILKVIYCIYMR